MYEVIIATDAEGKTGGPYYSRLSVRDRTQWKTKRIAEKHAREFKARHLKDAWAQEV